MSRRVPFTMFGFLICSCVVSSLSAQPVPVAAPRVLGNAYAPPAALSGADRKAKATLMKKVEELQGKLRIDLSDEEMQEVKTGLKKQAESLFDLETKSMEKSVKRLQERLDTRLAKRDELLKDRIEKLMTPPPQPGDVTFKIRDVKEKEDGSSVARVIFLAVEQRTRTVNVTEMVAEQRVRNVNGKEQVYTVNVPVAKQVEQVYTVNVSRGTKAVPVPKGVKPEDAVKKFLDDEQDF